MKSLATFARKVFTKTFKNNAILSHWTLKNNAILSHWTLKNNATLSHWTHRFKGL